MGRRANRLPGTLVVTRRRLLLAAAVGLAALAVVLVLSLRGGGGSTAVPTQPVTGVTHLSRSGTLFADPLQARVEVVVDRRRVDPSQVGIRTKFEPFVTVGIPRVEHEDSGRLTRLLYTVDLICLTNTCLSKDKPEPIRVQFPPAEIFYVRESGRRKILKLPWLGMVISGRTSELDTAGGDPFQQPSWRASTEPLAVSYTNSPGVLRPLLFVISGLLLAFGLFALLRFVVTTKLRLRILSPLERAVVLVERTPEESPERRKALELLSRELGKSGEPELALAARELAWSEPSPLPTLTEPLTLDVRRTIEERSNGHAH
jgi:hypothetical protein